MPDHMFNVYSCLPYRCLLSISPSFLQTLFSSTSAMSSLLSNSLFFIITSHVQFVLSNCYHPNGRSHLGSYLPCPDIPSICCALNHTIPASGETSNGERPRAECLPNRVCQERRTDGGVETQEYYRSLCTQPNLVNAGAKCLDICVPEVCE
jgi:hypothetical protein